MSVEVAEHERGERIPESFKVRVTFNADEEHVGVQLAEQVSKLLQDSIAAFNLTAQPHTMGLFTETDVQVAGRRQDGTDIQQTVQQAGLKPGQLLVLKQVVVSGG